MRVDFKTSSDKVRRVAAERDSEDCRPVMNLFLGEVAPGFEDFFAIMFIDQAGCSMSKKRTIPENTRLVPPPTYSPELNPAEHIWEALRKNTMPNRALTSLDELQETLWVRPRKFGNNPGRVRSPKGRNN